LSRIDFPKASRCRVRDRVVERDIERTQRRRCGEEPFFLKLLHLIDEAHAFFADAIALRNADAVEEHLNRIRRAHAELVEFLRSRDALRIHRNANERLRPVGRAVRRVDERAHPIGLGTVRRPHLAAVDHVVVTVLTRARLNRGDVGAGARLRDAETRDRLARDRRPQKFFAQFVRTVLRERGRRHVALHADRHRYRTAPYLAEHP